MPSRDTSVAPPTFVKNADLTSPMAWLCVGPPPEAAQLTAGTTAAAVMAAVAMDRRSINPPLGGVANHGPEIYRDNPQLPSLILTVHRETLTQYITYKRGGGDVGSLYSFTMYPSLATVTSCIDLSVRIVTKSPKVGPLLIFFSLCHGPNILQDTKPQMSSLLVFILEFLDWRCCHSCWYFRPLF